MLRDAVSALADVLRDEIGGELADDGIDAIVEPRLVSSPSESVVLDVYPGSSARVSDSAAMGDISGFYVLTVRVRVTQTDNDNMQDILLDMLDDEHALSIAAAIESDPTLNGYAYGVTVDPDGVSGLLEFGPMVGCTWRVLVGVAVS